MRSLYIEGSVFWERFKDPHHYLCARRQVENQLWTKFKEKGGSPKQSYPIYLVLGRPKWTSTVADEGTLATTDEIQVPLLALDEREVSFTYPDSMVSAMIAAERNPGYYEPEYHGQVFTAGEIRQIVHRKGMPGEGWETRMPKHLAHYIEAQVWNQAALLNFLERGASR
jgi:hypothetical protein